MYYMKKRINGPIEVKGSPHVTFEICISLKIFRTNVALFLFPWQLIVSLQRENLSNVPPEPPELLVELLHH